MLDNFFIGCLSGAILALGFLAANFAIMGAEHTLKELKNTSDLRLFIASVLLFCSFVLANAVFTI